MCELFFPGRGGLGLGSIAFGLRHHWTYFLRTLPDNEDLLEPAERAIADVLIPSILEHKCTQAERDILALLVRMGGLGIINPTKTATSEFTASRKATAPLAQHIVVQAHELPNEHEVRKMKQSAQKEKNDILRECQENVERALHCKTKRAFELAREKGSSNWLTVIPIKDMDFNLNNREFREVLNVVKVPIL